MKRGYVYILSNYTRTTFYIGVTSKLGPRFDEHQAGVGSKFVRKYNLKYLVYYEVFDRIEDAIRREKQLKKWHRAWKIRLIKSVNAEMRDLSEEIPWQ
ncbi:MAG: GIY-YIG nuclease family protein [Ignavibacteriae bacterium]|nr:GIY-YIG nuclease family protein [Ignavibacteriota bacterium]